MFLKNTISLEEDDEFSYLNDDFLNLFSLEEEDVLFFNNISLSENTLKSSPNEVKNEINNGIIPELSKKNQDFFNNYLEPKIIIPNESSAKKKLW